MSLGPSHHLIDAALLADLTQNELRVFLVLFRQTLCFGKTTDAMNLTRLLNLSHLRKDRLLQALAGLLRKGLFTVQAHGEYKQLYTIAEPWLGEAKQGFFVPSVLPNRKRARQTEGISEKQNITSLTNTSIKPTTTPKAGGEKVAAAENLPYPASFDAAQRHRAAVIVKNLAPDVARDCLLILTQSMQQQAVKSPLGYLYGLVQAFHENRLDRSVLKPAPVAAATPATNPNPTPDQQRLRALQAEIRGLDQLFAFAGTEMDERSAAKRAAWVAECQRLREKSLTSNNCVKLHTNAVSFDSLS